MISIFTLETAIIGGKKNMLGLFSGSGSLPLPPSLGAAPPGFVFGQREEGPGVLALGHLADAPPGVFVFQLVLPSKPFNIQYLTPVFLTPLFT